MGFKSFIIKADQVLGTPVAESTESQVQKLPIAESETTMMSFAYIACAAFIILTGRYVAGDFAVSELHIVNNLAAPSLTELMLQFDHSSHPLYHTVLWLWVDIFQGGVEAFLRLPGLAFMLITAYLLYAVGRRVLNSPGMGFLVMGLVIFSPAVVTRFSHLFGYSLSILLATLATLGALLIGRGKRRRGTILFGIGALLLPATLTAGIWLNFTLVAFLLAHFALQRKLVMNIIPIAFLSLLSSASAVVLYMSLSFNKNASNGNLSSIDATGQWLVGMAAQVALFTLVCAIANRQKDVAGSSSVPADKAELLRSHLWLLFLISIAGSSLYLLFTDSQPANALCFTVPLAFGAAGFLRPGMLRTNKYFLTTLMAILLNLLLWMRGSDTLTAQHVMAGSFRPNLIQQFPNGERLVSTATRSIRQMPNMSPNIRVFVDGRILPVFTWYWTAAGGKADALESMGADTELTLEVEHYMFLPKLAVGFSPEYTQSMLQEQLQAPVMLQELQIIGDLHVYRVLTPNPHELPLTPQPAPTPIAHPETHL